MSSLIIPSSMMLDAFAESQLTITPVRIGTHHVPEASGIVASRAYPGIFWMLSDSKNPARIYAIDWTGATKRTVNISGATNLDWEDIAIDSSGNIWIGDIGDNDQVRSNYVLYRIKEPYPYGSATSVSATAYRFTYPNGRHDSEALFVWQGIPYVMYKNLASEVYAFPTLDSSRTVTLKYVGKFTGGNMITGADISSDGRRLALINDNSNYHWIIERGASSSSIADFFTSPTKQWRIYFPNMQGEAISFFGGGYGFVVASETGDFWKIDREKYESASTSAPSPSPSTGKYTLAWGTYDYDNKGEVTVLLNGREMANLPNTNVPANSDTWVRAYLDISPFIANGENTLTFRQNFWSSAVRNLEINGPNGKIYSDPTTRYQSAGGQKYITYKFNTLTTTSTSTTTSVTSSPTLSFQGYDYDNRGEVSVLVNNRVVATLPAAESPQNNNLYTSYSFDISQYVMVGSNTITFKQNLYSSGVRSVKVTGLNGVILDDSIYRNLWVSGTSSVTYKFNVEN